MISPHDNKTRRMPMVSVPVQCPHCQSTEVIKAGKQANGAQRYRCQNGPCERRIFLLQYQDRGRAPEIRRQVVELAYVVHNHHTSRPSPLSLSPARSTAGRISPDFWQEAAVGIPSGERGKMRRMDKGP